MSGKNEGIQASTMPSPSKECWLPQKDSQSVRLGCKSSLSNASCQKKQQVDQHVTSYCSIDRLARRGKQELAISLVLGEQRYELDCASPARLQAHFQKIFSVRRLNEQTKASLKIVILSRVAQIKPVFHQMLKENYEEYSRQTLQAMREALE